MTNKAAYGGRSFVYSAAVVSRSGGLLVGYDAGVISEAILFIKYDFSLSHGNRAARGHEDGAGGNVFD